MQGIIRALYATFCWTRLGPYEITTLIGAGGMGEVYRSRDTKLKREVAIKVLPPEFSQDPERLRRFLINKIVKDAAPITLLTNWKPPQK